MATLKLKHLILYGITFLLLYFSNLPGGALLSIAAWMQISILLWVQSYTAKNQLNIFIYFLTLIPLFLFLGSSSSFITIYLKEGSLLFTLMAAIMTTVVTFLTITFSVFIFKNNLSNSNISKIYTLAIQNLTKERKQILKYSLAMMIFILLPLPMKQDFKISLSLILIHLYLNRKQILNLNF